mmetsp:Transcript_64484/g.151514  ORF Transcript_64484/g.151514 Transcript_64484/m.151514 type:complete len:203 (+) Transcript_64484:750-1358(+)
MDASCTSRLEPTSAFRTRIKTRPPWLSHVSPLSTFAAAARARRVDAWSSMASRDANRLVREGVASFSDVLAKRPRLAGSKVDLVGSRNCSLGNHLRNTRCAQELSRVTDVAGVVAQRTRAAIKGAATLRLVMASRTSSDPCSRRSNNWTAASCVSAAASSASAAWSACKTSEAFCRALGSIGCNAASNSAWSSQRIEVETRL